ncbi:MAG TPA: hypothetical protein VK658_09180 [Chryseolinea sp.]|nr:hypothetical protein [Chryseolinea sp.]
MYDVSTATLWNSEFALDVARRIASLKGIYCGPAAVGWISAVWNAKARIPYDYMGRLQDKQLFPDGPRSFVHAIPAFKDNLDLVLQRETHGSLGLSTNRYYRYRDIHALMHRHEMPFIVRIPTASVRDGLHYVTLFRTISTQAAFRCYWQDNGVFRSDEKMQEGISLSIRPASAIPFFPWGTRQVVRV